MKITRLTELSLYYKVKEQFKARKTAEILKSADFLTYNLKYTNIQLNETVSVYIGGVLQNTGYTLDYIQGIVRFDTALNATSVVTADYSYCTFNIYDEGVSPTSNEFKYPAIAIYETDSSDEPFELGNSKKERTSNWVLEVWTERGGESNDAKDTLLELFEGNLDIIDFNLAFPTNRDGSKNESFATDSRVIGYGTVESINSGKSGSLDIGDKPKYLNEIFVEFKINY